MDGTDRTPLPAPIEAAAADTGPEPTAHREVAHVSEPPRMDIEPSYAPAQDGVIRPRDPVTSKILEPGEIPPSLLADDGIRRGYDYLREHGDRTHLTILRMQHGPSDTLDPVHTGFDLQARAQALREKGGALYVETVGHASTMDLTRLLYNAAANAPAEEAAEMREGLRNLAREEPGLAFGAAIAERVLSTQVPVVQVDFTLGGERQADAVLTELRHRVKAADSARKQSGDVADYITYMWEKFGFDTYRDSYLLGRIGADMAARFGSSPTSDIHGELLAGAHHVNVGRRAQAFGAEVTVLGDPPAWDKGNQQYVDALGRGVLTAMDIMRTLEGY